MIRNRGEKAPGDTGQDVFIEFHRFQLTTDAMGGFLPIRCIVSGDFKLVINLTSSDELYDLRRDPLEMENRIDDPSCRRVRDELFERLMNWMYVRRDPFRGPIWEDRKWNTKRRMGFGWGTERTTPSNGIDPLPYDYETARPSIYDFKL